MIKTLIPAVALAAAALLAPLAAQAQTYNGNGNSDFSGYLGLGSLNVSESTAGDITIALKAGGNNGPSLGGNVAVVYIDSTTGGFSDTSTFTDNGASSNSNGTPGAPDHEAISGYSKSGQRAQVNFAPGFQADYAIAFQDTYLDLFQLQSGNTLNYVTGRNANGNGDLTFTFSAASIGLTAAQGFNFVGTLTNNDAFRSDEAVGDIGNAQPYPGYTTPITYTNFDTFTPNVSAAPEPEGIASALIGALVIGGCIMARRRTTSAAK